MLKINVCLFLPSLQVDSVYLPFRAGSDDSFMFMLLINCSAKSCLIQDSFILDAKSLFPYASHMLPAGLVGLARDLRRKRMLTQLLVAKAQNQLSMIPPYCIGQSQTQEQLRFKEKKQILSPSGKSNKDTFQRSQETNYKYFQCCHFTVDVLKDLYGSRVPLMFMFMFKKCWAMLAIIA